MARSEEVWEREEMCQNEKAGNMFHYALEQRRSIDRSIHANDILLVVARYYKYKAACGIVHRWKKNEHARHIAECQEPNRTGTHHYR
jgi:hypothetical protein